MIDIYSTFINKHFPEMFNIIRFAPIKLDYKNIIMFGAGKYAGVVLKSLPENINVRYIVDSNSQMVGKELGGIMVKPIE